MSIFLLLRLWISVDWCATHFHILIYNVFVILKQCCYYKWIACDCHSSEMFRNVAPCLIKLVMTVVFLSTHVLDLLILPFHKKLSIMECGIFLFTFLFSMYLVITLFWTVIVSRYVVIWALFLQLTYKRDVKGIHITRCNPPFVYALYHIRNIYFCAVHCLFCSVFPSVFEFKSRVWFCFTNLLNNGILLYTLFCTGVICLGAHNCIFCPIYIWLLMVYKCLT